MAEHTREARERGFGEVEHLARNEVRQRPPVEGDRARARRAGAVAVGGDCRGPACALIRTNSMTTLAS